MLIHTRFHDESPAAKARITGLVRTAILDADPAARDAAKLELRQLRVNYVDLQSLAGQLHAVRQFSKKSDFDATVIIRERNAAEREIETAERELAEAEYKVQQLKLKIEGPTGQIEHAEQFGKQMACGLGPGHELNVFFGDDVSKFERDFVALRKLADRAVPGRLEAKAAAVRAEQERKKNWGARKAAEIEAIPEPVSLTD